MAIGAVCLLATRLDRAQSALALLAATAPLEIYRTTVGPVNVSLFRLALLVVVFAAGLRVWRRRRFRVLEDARPARLAIVYGALLLLLVVSLAVKPVDPVYGLRLVGIVALGLVCLVAISELAEGISAERLLALVALGSVLPVLAASWQAIGPAVAARPALPYLSALPLTDELNKSRDEVAALGELGMRVKGTFADPNHFAVYLALTLTFAVALLLLAVARRDLRGFVSYGSLSVANGTILVLTYSRTGWLAATLSVVVLAALAATTLRASIGGRRLIKQVAGVAIVLMALAIPLAPSVSNRLDPSVATNQSSNQDHQKSIEAALEAFAEHPLTGVGVGGLGLLLDQGPRTSGAHSSYATIAAELGFAGLTLLLVSGLLTVGAVGARLRRAVGLERLVAAAMLAGYLGFLMANGLYDLWFDDWHFVVLGVIGVAAPVSALIHVPAPARGMQ